MNTRNSSGSKRGRKRKGKETHRRSNFEDDDERSSSSSNWSEASSNPSSNKADEELSSDYDDFETKPKSRGDVKKTERNNRKPSQIQKRRRRRACNSSHSSSSTTSSKNNVSKNEKSRTTGTSKPAEKMPYNPLGMELATHGDHVLLFQDDRTGRKRVHPSALRVVMDIIQEETGRTTKSIAAELLRNNEKDESRRVQVRSRSHVQNIVSEVRRKMADVNVPARYVQKQDHMTAVDLRKMNEIRKREIESNSDVALKLVEEVEDEKRAYESLQERKKELVEKLSQETSAVYTSDGARPAFPSAAAVANGPHHLIRDACARLAEKREEAFNRRAVTDANKSHSKTEKVQPSSINLKQWLSGSSYSSKIYKV